MLRENTVPVIVITVVLGLAIPAFGLTSATPVIDSNQAGQGHAALSQEEDGFSNVTVGTASFDTMVLENVTLTNVRVRSLTIENLTAENETRESVVRENVTLERIGVNGTLHNVTMQNLVVNEQSLAASLFSPTYAEQNASVETFRVSIRVLENRSINGIVLDELTVQDAEVEQFTEDQVTPVDETPTETVTETPRGERPENVTETPEPLNTTTETPTETPVVEEPEVAGAQPALSADGISVDSIENATAEFERGTEMDAEPETEVTTTEEEE